MTTLSTTLANLYLDYFNNYLTVSTFAEHHGLTEIQARTLLDIGRDVHETRIRNFNAA